MSITAVQDVSLVFKTHLDVGFTDLSANVVNDYFTRYLPQASALAARLRDLGRPERFIWTTGSWLIYTYLEQVSAAERRLMEAAIAQGDIRWHALPFTTHTELLDPSLLRAGLRLSQTLDRRFGTVTHAGMLTDVPGHTRSLIPYLAEAGVEFLHVGINDASALPVVPPLFRWQEPGGASIVVMYHHTYGGSLLTPDGRAALLFNFTYDNVGPPQMQSLIPIFVKARQQFPEAHVHAATLDDAIAPFLRFTADLPVITQEIGDTWIHGVGSDPQKVQQYRALARLRAAWIASGEIDETDPALEVFSRQLLLVAEHTWGLDTIMHLADTHSYQRPDFVAARERGAFATFERSWQEQRDYIAQSLEKLTPLGRKDDATAALQALRPHAPPATLQWQTAPPEPCATPLTQLAFDPATGSIHHLTDRRTGRAWATPAQPLALLRYDIYGAQDYARYLAQYIAPSQQQEWWVGFSFGKPGLATGAQSRQSWLPQAQQWAREDLAEATRLWARVALPAECQRDYGAPAHFLISYTLSHTHPRLDIAVQWQDKPACRITEALWFSFQPPAQATGEWRFDKLGGWVAPTDVVPGGNHHLHGVHAGVEYRDAQGALTLLAPDTPLVAPGMPQLLQFDAVVPRVAQGVHVNLYNNQWATNFPLWVEGDAHFHFTLTWGEHEHE